MSRPTLKQGAKGADVVYLQERLSRHGHHLTADGIFGSGTAGAVKQFQASENLGVDGIVGKNTWEALDSEGEGTADTQTEAPTSEKEKLLAKIPTGLDATRRKVLACAIADLGKSEQGSSNWSPEIAHLVDGYNEFWKTGSTSKYPWCAMACSVWIGTGTGHGSSGVDMDWRATPIGKFYGGASQYEDLGKKDGWWVEETEEAPAGSVFTMARGGSSSDPSQSTKAGHVGMVICDNGDGTVTTVEGNVSNKVKTYDRKKSDLHGFVTWWA